MFDERQWMYAEDLELGWRLREHGWATYYEPAAHVHHASGASTELAFAGEQRERFLAATYALLARRRGALRMWTTAIVNVFGAVLRVVWMTPLAVLRPDWRSRAADSRAWLWAHVHAIGLRSTLREPL
jgi:GT2 family glycosyltransferase